MKKKIGISFTATNFTNYLQWFDENDLGDSFELVTLSFEENNIEDMLQCDGFLLTGGVDVHPSLYDGAEQYPNMPNTFQQDRDHFESKIYRHAQQLKRPVLGICRGLQLVNILEGGRLIQDLGEQKNQVHRKLETDKKHSIEVNSSSLLYRLSGVVSGEVNSAHHQSIDPLSLPSSLKAVAFADDQTIEAIEYSDASNKGFMLCVQWHPERMDNKATNPLSINIKKAFLNAITQRYNENEHC
jgi:putative glutamine amidotransferase